MTTIRRIIQRLARQGVCAAQDTSSTSSSSLVVSTTEPWNTTSQLSHHRCLYSSSSSAASSSSSSSPFDPTNHSVKGKNNNNNNNESSPKQQRQRRRQRPLTLVPLKPAIRVTAPARKFFRRLLQNPPRPDICGCRLNYGQPASGEPRMVFSFTFVTPQELEPFDEAVPLEEEEMPAESENETTEETTTTTTTPTLYVSGNAFLKVLGATVDVDQNFTPVLYDKEGNRMDPNA